ncbi:unnamed protein product [Protopolystoma xenopodis]|uniref:Uncharacterized protein n=1 Tax=Protopolystoma xenopodis TaxID=117903 RepID=A0A448WII2_9PLAT|nr:unnamed protein product [Protopolystoma xenopodis]
MKDNVRGHRVTRYNGLTPGLDPRFNFTVDAYYVKVLDLVHGPPLRRQRRCEAWPKWRARPMRYCLLEMYSFEAFRMKVLEEEIGRFISSEHDAVIKP